MGFLLIFQHSFQRQQLLFQRGLRTGRGDFSHLTVWKFRLSFRNLEKRGIFLSHRQRQWKGLRNLQQMNFFITSLMNIAQKEFHYLFRIQAYTLYNHCERYIVDGYEAVIYVVASYEWSTILCITLTYTLIVV